MNIPANIRVNAAFPFPALVQGSGPITISKANGIWTVGYNGALLGQINTSAPITGGPIDLSGGGGSIGLAPSGVTPGSYTSANISVDTFGRILAATNGSGGGGGGTVVATVPSLAGVSPSIGAVLVSDPLRGGLFGWIPGVFTAAVAADFNQAIYVALTSDPTALTGVWKRLYVGPAQSPWFQFISDGVVNLGPPTHSFSGDFRSTYTTTVVSGTDNAPAWNGMLSWARYEDNQGRGVIINFLPGNYNYNMANMVTAGNFPGTYGIKKLLILGYGATFTNTYNETVSGASFLASPWLLQCAPFVTGPLWAGDGVIPAGGAQPIAFKINTTAPGDTSITLQTAARTSYFSVGEKVLVGSFDLQMSGYPPNMGYIDFNQIGSINAGTGACGLNWPLSNAHRSDFNDYTATGSTTYPCGAARIWKLDTTGYGYGIPVPWQIEQQFEGMQVNLPPGIVSPGNYTTISGETIITKNWKGVGLSQSVMKTGRHTGDHYWTAPEIDKDIGSLDFDTCEFDFNSGAQSSSVDRINYKNCLIGGIGIGAKRTTFIGCRVKPQLNGNIFNVSASQGLAGPASFIDCSLESYVPTTIIPGVLDSATPMTVSTDGSTPITYAAGTFILAVNQSGGQALLPQFIGVPGQFVSLQAAGAPSFTGDLGTGEVVGMRNDATHVYIDTTLQFATLPAFAVSGVLAHVFFFGNTGIDFRNCSGSDQARIVSEACAAGYDYWNRKTYVIAGVSSGGQLAGWLGSLIAADINVRQASTTSTDVITVTYPTYNDTTMAADAGGTVITINTGVKGSRLITQAMFVGKVGTDGITVGGAAASFLPGGKLIGDVAQWGKSGTVLTASQSPVVEMAFMFSTGIVRRAITANFNRTSSGSIFASTGLLT